MGTRKTREELDAELNQGGVPDASEPPSDTDVEPPPEPEDAGQASPEKEEMARELIEPALAPTPAVETPEAVAMVPEVEAPSPPAPGAEAEEGQPAEAGLLPRMKMICESLLFASGQPLPSQQLLAVLRELQPDLSASGLRGVLEQLRTELREGGRGIRLVEVAGGYQLRTPSESAPFVRRLIARRPPRMTQATIETLAIVAYRQPVTRAEVEDIRGVESGAVLKHLLDRRLVRILGRKDEPGRPLLYGTTKEFLALFSLKDLKSLPTLRDFVELSNEHRAALGLPLMEEAAAPEAEALPGMDVLEIEQTAAFTPVGDDEIVQELAVALEELKKRNRNLRALLPVPAEEPDGTAASPEAMPGVEGAPMPADSPVDDTGTGEPQQKPPRGPEETPPPDGAPPAKE